MNGPSPSPPLAAGELPRRLGLWQAVSLNVTNMIGIGPFITIPAFIAAMGGPQAVIAWLIAALLVICDGLVWSELGAALPGSGGSYHFLRAIFGPYRWGRLLPFLFIWQFLISGALEMASGYIGGLAYLEYACPSLANCFPAWGGTRWFAAATAAGVTLVLCQNVGRLGWLSVVFCAGTLLTVAIVIIAGLSNFRSSLLRLPTEGVVIDAAFAKGLGAAMLIAIYDYLGYYNICHLGDEVIEPSKTIPRAILISVVVVAAIYLTMNVAIIGVIPWREAMESKNIAALFMERLYGRSVAVGFTALILWTSLACLFALMLGYSRIPYAAAQQGDFFAVFGKLHPRGQFPIVSLAVLGALTALFCFFDLTMVINAAVAVRILVQFVAQIIGLHLLHTTRPDVRLPFRMWLYPLPSIIALAGWLFVFTTTDRSVLIASLAVLGSGCLAFFIQRFLAAR